MSQVRYHLRTNIYSETGLFLMDRITILSFYDLDAPSSRIRSAPIKLACNRFRKNCEHYFFSQYPFRFKYAFSVLFKLFYFIFFYRTNCLILIKPLPLKWMRFIWILHYFRSPSSVIYDVDDAIYLSRATSQFVPAVLRAFQKARVVVVGNKVIFDDLANRLTTRVVVVPSSVQLFTSLPSPLKVPEAVTRDSETESPGNLCVLWIGSGTTQQYLVDFLTAIPRNISGKFSLTIVSDEDPFETRFPDFSCPIPYQFIQWQLGVERQFSHSKDLVGIMPLQPGNIWDERKCGYKLLEYSALRIFPVVSNTKANAEIVNATGVGSLCDDYNSMWDRLEQIAIEGFDTSPDFSGVDRYSLEHAANSWANLLNVPETK